MLSQNFKNGGKQKRNVMLGLYVRITLGLLKSNLKIKKDTENKNTINYRLLLGHSFFEVIKCFWLKS